MALIDTTSPRTKTAESAPHRLSPEPTASVRFSKRRLRTADGRDHGAGSQLYVLSSTVTKALSERLLQRMRRLSWPRRAVERLLTNLFWRLYCPRCQRLTRWRPSYNNARVEEDLCLTELSCRRCNLVCRDGFLPESIARRKLLWYERH